MAIRYAVDSVRDDQGALLNRLTQIADDGGRVVSITWQPERQVFIEIEDRQIGVNSGFTVVSEFDQ